MAGASTSRGAVCYCGQSGGGNQEDRKDGQQQQLVCLPQTIAVASLPHGPSRPSTPLIDDWERGEARAKKCTFSHLIHEPDGRRPTARTATPPEFPHVGAEASIGTASSIGRAT